MKNENELKTITEDAQPLDVICTKPVLGAMSRITLRRVPLKDMSELAKADQDDIATAKLYIAEDDRYQVEHLTDESLMDVLEKGDEINAPLYDRWKKRQRKKMERMGISVEALIKEEMAKELESAKSSPTSSPEDSPNNSSSTAANQSSASTTNTRSKTRGRNKPS